MTRHGSVATPTRTGDGRGIADDAQGIPWGTFPPPAAARFGKAWRDLARAFRMWHLWARLVWVDLARQYKRTALGPFWAVLGRGLTIVLIGVVFGSLFRVASSRYLPYVAAGMVAWGLINGLIGSGCRTFSGNRSVIVQTDLPLSIHAYGRVCSAMLRFAHELTICLAVGVAFAVWPGWARLLLPVGIAMIWLNGLWVALLLGVVSARYGAFPTLVGRAMRLLFFVTPVIWTAERLPARALLVDVNPLYHFIELVRAPLLGQVPSGTTWIAVLAVTIVGWSAAVVVFARYRGRLAYWI